MREKIKLVSTAATGHIYNTTKNKKTIQEKYEIKNYDQGITDALTQLHEHTKQIVGI